MTKIESNSDEVLYTIPNIRSYVITIYLTPVGTLEPEYMAHNASGDNSVLYSSIRPIVVGSVLITVAFVLADRFLGFYNPNLLLMAILGLLIFVPLFNLIRSGWNPFQ